MTYTEESRVVSVTAKATKGNFSYAINYQTKSKQLLKLTCSVTEHVTKSIETSTGSQEIVEDVNGGIMIVENGQNQIHLRSDLDIISHLEVFNEVLTKVK